MSDKLGNDFNLYIDSSSSYAGTFSTPTWVLFDDCGDVKRDHSPERVEIPKRRAFKFYKMGRKDLTFTFTMNYDPANAAHTAIIAAIETGVAVHLAIADGPIATTGTKYWHGMFMVVGPEDFALDKGASIDVDGKPHADAPSSSDPVKVTAA